MSSDSEPYGLNEVDDFMKNKEKITFQNSTLAQSYKHGRRRDEYNEDEEYSDEEVMNIDDEESSGSDNDDQEVGEDDSDAESDALDGAAVYKKLFGKKLRSADEIEDLDEEDENNWGSTKANYYGADNVSDNEDDAKAMEEEAKKQQKQHMESLNMMDFMDLDDEEEQKNWDKSAKEYNNKAFEGSQDLVQVEKENFQAIKNFSEEEKLEFLRAKFPEFIPLFKEYGALNKKLESIQESLSSLDNETPDELSTVLNLKKTALLSNLASINLYFMLLLHNLQDSDNDEFKNMKYHPVMEKILLTKEIVRQADLLPEHQVSGGAGHADDYDVMEEDVEEMDENFLADAALEEEAGELSEDNSQDEGSDDKEEAGELSEDKEEADYLSEDISEDNSEDENIDGSVLNDEPDFKSRIQNTSHAANRGDFVEGEIDDIDLAEKNLKKKSLRFYTAKISKSDRQQADKLIGGDDDIPYKERMFERKQRLLEEAKKRGMQKADDFGAANDDDEVDMDEVNEINNYNSAEIEDFYNSVNKNKQDKKSKRMEAHVLAKQGSTEGRLDDLKEVLDEDGKRAINYQILKNKGLTPHRNKDNRNSRVKKRKKYEKAQKKLRSMKQVYTGPHDGRYQGEKSGIRKDLTKSVKL